MNYVLAANIINCFVVDCIENGCIDRCIGDCDGVGIAGSGEARECREIPLSDGGGNDAGCFICEGIGLRSGGSAAVDGDVYISEIADAVGGDSFDELSG